MGHIQLTRGYIGKALRGEELPPNPVIQILGIKVIPAQQGKVQRHRLIISDGEHTYDYALLASSLNDLVTQNKISCFAVISVGKMECSGGFNKKFLFITSLEVKQYARLVGRKLGDPVPWVEPRSPELYPTHTDQSSSSTDSSKGKSGTWQGNFAVPTNRPPQSRASSTVLGRGSLYNSSGSSSSNNSNNVRASGVSLYKCPDLSGQRGRASSGGNQTRNAGAGHMHGNGENINSSRSEVNDAALVPIRDLSHVIRKVTIRARVTNKGQIKTWENSKGKGKLFTIDLMDDSGQIQMTGFNQSVDEFYDAIEINNVYYFKNFQVQHAKLRFSNIGHEYSVSFLPDTQVISYLKDSSSIPSLTFNFVSIDEISNIQPEAIVDVIGICKSYQEAVQVVKVQSTGKELEKRELSLVDTTRKMVNITLWGNQAIDFSDGSQPVIAVKGAKVSDFGGGRSLSVLTSSVFQIIPDLPEAHALRGWYDNEGFASDFKSISGLTTGIYGNSWTPRKVIAEAITLSSENLERPEYFVAKVTIISIKPDPMYKACIAEACNKKVVDLQNGFYRCEKCKVEQSSFKWRLLLQVNFSDFTGDFWSSCFTEIGETIFQKSTEELALLYSEKPDEFEDVMKAAIFQQFIGKFRSRMETYKNKVRKKIGVLELNRINHAEYAKHLLAEIQETRSS